MTRNTKILLTVGGVLVAGGVIYLVSRDDDKPANGGGLSSGGPKPARHGMWQESRRAEAEDFAAQAYTDMGAPSDFSWTTVVAIAHDVASKMYPSIDWPLTVAQSDSMLLKRTTGYAIWQQVFLIAQKAVGYIPEIGP